MERVRVIYSGQLDRQRATAAFRIVLVCKERAKRSELLGVIAKSKCENRTSVPYLSICPISIPYLVHI